MEQHYCIVPYYVKSSLQVLINNSIKKPGVRLDSGIPGLKFFEYYLVSVYFLMQIPGIEDWKNVPKQETDSAENRQVDN